MISHQFQICLFLCGIYSAQQAFITSNWFRVIQFTPCDEAENYNMQTKNFKMVDVKDDVILRGEIEVKEDVHGEISLQITPARCDFSKKKCEEQQSLRFAGICASMKSFNMFGSSFKNDIQPPLKCPFKKGIYTFNNVTANVGVISKFPIGGHLWAAEIKFLDRNDNIIFCGNSGIIVKDPRKRGK